MQRKNTSHYITSTILAAWMLAGSNASALPIAYNSFSGTVINFDGLTGAPSLGSGEVLANQYTGLGVSFSVLNFSATANNGILATGSTLTSLPNVIWVDQGGGGGGSSAQGMVITFSTAQSAVGLYFEGSRGSTFTLSVYAGASLIESLTSGLAVGGSGLEGFLALQDPNITRAIVSSANSSGQNWNFSVDNLKFTGDSVPEPSSIMLFAFGLTGFGLLRRFNSR